MGKNKKVVVEVREVDGDGAERAWRECEGYGLKIEQKRAAVGVTKATLRFALVFVRGTPPPSHSPREKKLLAVMHWGRVAAGG